MAVIVLLLLIFFVEDFSGNLKKRKMDIAQGRQMIEQAEEKDVAVIEGKIEQLEEKERDETRDSRSLKEMFASTVIMGDSIAEGFSEYDTLNPSSVVSKIGIELHDTEEMDKQIKKIKKLNPQNIFLCYGLNDILATQGNTTLFADRYKALIDQIKEAVPGAKIFVNALFTVKEDKIQEEPLYGKISDYNKTLRELCDKKQVAFVDNAFLVEDKYYAEDGIHFMPDFYPIWARQMAEVASL